LRPDWAEYFLGIATAVSTRADCSRRQVGCVIVKDHRIVSTGYNGAPSGQPGCLAGACPRGRHYRSLNKGGSPAPDGLFGKMCVCGNDWPCPDAVEPGSSYDTGPGACIALHAEANAIIYADFSRCQGATMYITDTPCEGCRKLIAGAGIRWAIWPEGHWNVTGVLPAW
jgi:dCMP deaminase